MKEKRSPLMFKYLEKEDFLSMMLLPDVIAFLLIISKVEVSLILFLAVAFSI